MPDSNMALDLSSVVPPDMLQHIDNRTVDTGQDDPFEGLCSLESERHYDVVPTVVCSLCCLFGLVYTFFGYRCFKAIMFLSGLLAGSAVIFVLCYKERIMDTQLSIELSAGIALGIGLLCGLVTMLVHSVGLFMTGLLLGLLLAIASLVGLEQFYHPPTAWIPVGLMMGFAMLFAVLTLQWQKLFTVVSTATFGAAILTVCTDYFIELMLLVQYVYDRLRLETSHPLCWYSWVVLGMWPVLSILGIVVQWKLTAEGFSHTDGQGCASGELRARYSFMAPSSGTQNESGSWPTKLDNMAAVIISRRQKRLQLLRIRQKDAKKRQNVASQEGTYRRKANPMKRYTGDILAPSYLQSLRERQTGTGTSMSSLSTNMQTIVDMDYECGSTVPLTATTPVIHV
ncbi:transmembrane protein 198 isoform X3 [Xenopus laevis]|uniref:Transmembrane protein 198 n=1 Tax=Xenopus laevis TaxID=8355 RepID=A0A8J1MBJ9_XENLA|nr:transmembrane protein 198 isoform X3 [Xenopus laevis]